MATCNVLIEAISAGGALRAGVAVGFFGSVPTGVGTQVIDNSLVSVTTDVNGAATAVLEQGALVRVTAPALGVDGLTLLIPLASSANFWMLVAAAIAEPPTPASPFALEADLLAEVTRAEGAETDIALDLTDETNAREVADTLLQTHIDNEVTRAQTAEGILSGDIGAETTARETAITNESMARVTGDSTNASAIAAEATTRGNADTALQANITSETTRAEAEEAALAAAIAGFASLVTTAEVALGEGVTLRLFDYPPVPSFKGIRIDAPSGAYALIAIGSSIYAYDPVGGTGARFVSDNGFGLNSGGFTVDSAGNLKAATATIAGVAVSESPANVMQLTLPDLSTLVPVRLRGFATVTAPSSSSDAGIEGETRFVGAFAYHYASGAWGRAAITYSAF